MEIFYVLTAVRLLVPLTILRWPLAGLLLSNLADLYDWQFAPVGNEIQVKNYQTWDKAMDFYYWLFALVIVFRWKDKLAKWIAIGLFSYRIVGMVAFFFTGERALLFFFPNVFENFVILYLAYQFIFKRDTMLDGPRTTALVLGFLTIPKLLHEYLQHFTGKHPWEYWNTGGFLDFSGLVEEYTNYFFWGGLFYVVPFLLLLLYFWKFQKINKL